MLASTRYNPSQSAIVEWYDLALRMVSTPTSFRSASQGFWLFLARERLLLLLLTATFALICWQHWGMNRSILLDSQSRNVRVVASTDRDEGGQSVCRIENDSLEWRLVYDVQPGADWAYCGIKFQFQTQATAAGIDLSQFDTLVVNLGGLTGTNQALQVQLKSMDPNVYRQGNRASLKYQNMVLFPERLGVSRNAMPLNYFVLPPWWVARNHVPVRFQNPDRHDVRELEFVTSADMIRLGKGVVTIRSLEFHGKLIDQLTLLKLLLGIWFVYILSGLGLRLYKSLLSNRRLEHRTTVLQDLAERDALTTLFNRRGLESHLPTIATRIPDSTNPGLGVLMLDLDHFKKVNDNLGHEAGDVVLRLAGKILLEEMRPNNLCARWGGEEFIVLFPGISESRLLPVAEKLRARIEAELHWNNHHITASIGIAHGPPVEFAKLAKRADEALYRAKANGRNRVEA